MVRSKDKLAQKLRLHSKKEKVDETGNKNPKDVLSEADYRSLFAAMTESFALRELVFDLTGKIKDYRFLDINPSFEKFIGLPRKAIVGKLRDEIPVPANPESLKKYAKVALTGKAERFESYNPALKKHFSVYAYRPAKNQFATIFTDITERKKSEEALLAANNRFKLAQQSSGAGIWDWDFNSGEIIWSPELYRIFGLDAAKCTAGLDVWQNILHPDDKKTVWKKMAAAIKNHIQLDSEYRVILPNKDTRWINALGNTVYGKNEKPERMSGICIDITPRKKAEIGLLKINKTLKALSSSNAAITHAANEAEYLNEVCRIIVNDCGHKLAWVGFAESDKRKTVRAIAGAGFEKGYLKTQKITWDENDPRGKGPTGTAIREGRAQQCKNILTDPRFNPWRKEAQKRGYASSIALPLIAGGKTFGALMIYSAQADPFSQEEITLLNELANDIGVGINSIRLRASKEKFEKELRETGEYLDNLLTYANAPIIVWDTSFRITKFNRAFENLAGINAKQAIGKSLEILFPKTYKKKSMDLIKSALAGKNWETVEIPILRHDNNIRTVIWNSANIKDDKKNVIATIAQGQDITERKIAEEQKRRAQLELKEHALRLEKAIADLKNLELAVENASDIIFITDSHGNILSINKAAESILGYKTNDIIGNNISMFGSPVDPEFYRRMWREIKKGGRIFSGEVANIGQDGKKRFFDLKTSPIINRSGEILFFIGIMRDRTEAKEIDRAKTEFISLMAHQLRTPLATMTMAAEMIMNGNIGKIDDDAKEQLRAIYDSAYKMSDLIELFLNLSRIELGRLQIDPEPIQMEELAHDLIREIMLQAKAKNIAFEINFAKDLPTVNVDRRIMHIALENILANAIKYTAAGGKIIFAIRADSESIICSVADTGCGIPKSQLPLIGTKMFRGANVGDIPGMGLGLNMAKNTIEQSGGAISFQSEENKGSTFSIIIPLSGMKKKSIRMES